ncbi:MAG TPA: B12-binding domain-containing protein [Pyrinomonadaceae bacterium]|nr:B12-binding domain-containing protein [Pyrinomonadaceae bacterium]
MSTRANSLRKTLTSKEAARLLGVSEASVKRWADGGLLPTVKTAGGHRRFRPEDVAVFRRERLHNTGRPSARASAETRRAAVATSRGAANREEAAALMYDVLVGGHAEEAASILVSLHLEGAGVAALADEVLCPAMRRVGDLWHQGELSVAQEHVATRAALEALQALRASLHPHAAHGRRGVCCAAEDDFHELPVQVAALVLEALGWEVVNLGTSTPFYALAEAIGRFAPRLVCVASTILEGLDRAAREYGEVRRAAARFGSGLVIGGAGFAGEDVRRRFPAGLYAEDFGQLEQFAVSLAEEGETT